MATAQLAIALQSAFDATGDEGLAQASGALSGIVRQQRSDIGQLRAALRSALAEPGVARQLERGLDVDAMPSLDGRLLVGRDGRTSGWMFLTQPPGATTEALRLLQEALRRGAVGGHEWPPVM
jgi:hypothetical protein